MLSKPRLESSAGSSVEESTSSASRSRIALAYSARFMRWSGARPGLGLAAAARSTAVSMRPRTRRAPHARAAWRRRAASGRRAPCGPPSPTSRRPRPRDRATAVRAKAAGLQPVVVTGDAVGLGITPGDELPCARLQPGRRRSPAGLLADHRRPAPRRRTRRRSRTASASFRGCRFAAGRSAISFFSSAIASGLATGGRMARKMPSANIIGVLPPMSG